MTFPLHHLLFTLAARTGAVSKVPEWFDQANSYTANTHPGELYNLREDLAQKHNLFAEQPDKVKELTALLEQVRADGPGPLSHFLPSHP